MWKRTPTARSRDKIRLSLEASWPQIRFTHSIHTSELHRCDFHRSRSLPDDMLTWINKKSSRYFIMGPWWVTTLNTAEQWTFGLTKLAQSSFQHIKASRLTLLNQGVVSLKGINDTDRRQGKSWGSRCFDREILQSLTPCFTLTRSNIGGGRIFWYYSLIYVRRAADWWCTSVAAMLPGYIERVSLPQVLANRYQSPAKTPAKSACSHACFDTAV